MKNKSVRAMAAKSNAKVQAGAQRAALGVAGALWSVGMWCCADSAMAAEIAAGDAVADGAARLRIILLAVGILLIHALLLLIWWKRRRDGSNQHGSQGQAPGFSTAFGNVVGNDVPVPDAYRSDNVGNDASARPWERTTTAFVGMGAGSAGCACLIHGKDGSGKNGMLRSCGMDTAEFLELARKHFLSLQAAWDRCDTDALRAMLTVAMQEEIGPSLGDCAQRRKARSTDIVAMEVRLLGVRDEPDEYRASVEFSGMIREDPANGPIPFREMWTMTLAKQEGAGWLLAGYQAMQ